MLVHSIFKKSSLVNQIWPLYEQSYVLFSFKLSFDMINHLTCVFLRNFWPHLLSSFLSWGNKMVFSKLFQPICKATTEFTAFYQWFCLPLYINYELRNVYNVLSILISFICRGLLTGCKSILEHFIKLYQMFLYNKIVF